MSAILYSFILALKEAQLSLPGTEGDKSYRVITRGRTHTWMNCAGGFLERSPLLKGEAIPQLQVICALWVGKVLVL